MKIDYILYFLLLSLLTVTCADLLYSNTWSVPEILGIFLIGFTSFTWFQVIIFLSYFLLRFYKISILFCFLTTSVLTILMNWILFEAGFIEVRRSFFQDVLLFKPISIFTAFLIAGETIRYFWRKRKTNERIF